MIFCGLAAATEARGLLVAVLVVVDLGGGWDSFFFGCCCGLAALSEESDSELLSVDADEPEPDPAELLELAELSDLIVVGGGFDDKASIKSNKSSISMSKYKQNC